MIIEQNLPSLFQIGEKVYIKVCNDCPPDDESNHPDLIPMVIVSVKFTETKIFYDCLDPAEPNLHYGIEENQLYSRSTLN